MLANISFVAGKKNQPCHSVRLFLPTVVSKFKHELIFFIAFIVFWLKKHLLCAPSDFFSVLAGCSGCGQDGEPSAESGSGNLQSSRQTRATDQAPLATFDPQQTADPLVPLVPYTSPCSTGQGEDVLV